MNVREIKGRNKRWIPLWISLTLISCFTGKWDTSVKFLLACQMLTHWEPVTLERCIFAKCELLINHGIGSPSCSLCQTKRAPVFFNPCLFSPIVAQEHIVLAAKKLKWEITYRLHWRTAAGLALALVPVLVLEPALGPSLGLGPSPAPSLSPAPSPAPSPCLSPGHTGCRDLALGGGACRSRSRSRSAPRGAGPSWWRSRPSPGVAGRRGKTPCPWRCTWGSCWRWGQSLPRRPRKWGSGGTPAGSTWSGSPLECRCGPGSLAPGEWGVWSDRGITHTF